jgi:aminopeptidase YwaD
MKIKLGLVLGTFAYLSFYNIQAQVLEHGRQHVQRLCNSDFHGRGYVNGGDSIAAEYIANQFKAIGCKSFKNSYFQSYSFPVNTFPNQMAVSINGKNLTPGVDFIVSPSSGGGKKQNESLIVLTLNDLMDGKAFKARISSMAQQAGSRQKMNGTFLIPCHLYAGDTLKRAKELAKELSQSFNIIQTTKTKFTWSVAQEQQSKVFLEVNERAINWADTSFEISYSIDATMRNHTARNVIAFVPAKRKSKKYFVFTAHYDHLGRMGKDTYFPGGNDNASGTSLLIELANYYKENPANVNIVFIAFSGEEVGLLGSKYYTQHPFFDMKKIAFLFNIDIMGSGEDGVTIVNGTIFPEQFKKLQNINEEKKYLTKIGSRGEAANSDHYFFTKAGVPAFFMYTAGPNKNYHDVNDTYDALSFAEFEDLFHLLKDFQSVVAPKRK